jgi:polysaccharide biosynthesis/export protein
MGCRTFDFYTKSLMSPLPKDLDPPRESALISLPAYRVEPPDVLHIEVLKLIPRQPYQIESFDVFLIQATGTPRDAPISNYYLVDGEGMVDLGPAYGKVSIAGMTIDQAVSIITQYLRQILVETQVSMQLARCGGTQQITGTYLVQTEGVINLRQYGVVTVAGKTVLEIREAIEKQLAEYFDSPQVTVEIIGYNSKTYYVIREGTLLGEDVTRLPITGKETVLDAIGAVGGLSKASNQRVWLERPAPGNAGGEQILPVDYLAITRGASSATNYQLLPGDRIFMAEDGLLTATNSMTKVIDPIYGLLGISQLSANAVKNFQIMGRAYNGITRF